jgi:DNA polymerase III alpha subunit (gram-positive type)
VKIKKYGSIYLKTHTTGLDEDAHVIEIAIIDDDDNILLDTLVNCDKKIDPESSLFHGIHDADLVGAPEWPAVLDKVISLIQEAELVMTYNGEFDMYMLKNTAFDHGEKLIDFDYQCIIDCLAYHEELYDYMSLSDACDRYRVDVTDITEIQNVVIKRVMSGANPFYARYPDDTITKTPVRALGCCIMAKRLFDQCQDALAQQSCVSG